MERRDRRLFVSNWCDADIRCYSYPFGIVSLVFILAFLLMRFLIYEPVFRPTWEPRHCRILDGSPRVRPSNSNCPDSSPQMLEWTVEINTTTTTTMFHTTMCASYNALDWPAGGPGACYHNLDMYPYTFKPYPLWWCTVCRDKNCADLLHAYPPGWNGPCFFSEDAAPAQAGYPTLSFAVIDRPRPPGADALWAWIAIALVCSTVYFTLIEYALANAAVVPRPGISDEWWIRAWHILLITTQARHCAWTVLTYLHVTTAAPSVSHVNSVSLALLLCWLIGATRWVGTQLAAGCQTPVCMRPTLFCLGWSTAWRLGPAEAMAVISRELITLVWIDSWASHLPLIIIGLCSLSELQIWTILALLFELVYLGVATWLFGGIWFEPIPAKKKNKLSTHSNSPCPKCGHGRPVCAESIVDAALPPRLNPPPTAPVSAQGPEREMMSLRVSGDTEWKSTCVS